MEQRDGSHCVPGAGSDVADVRARRLLCCFQQVSSADLLPELLCRPLERKAYGLGSAKGNFGMLS